MGTRQSLKRVGSLTLAEKNVVAALVSDSPREISPNQVTALAKALRRSKSAIKSAIEDAQAEFHGSAGRYVEIHQQATEAALKNGSVAGLEAAMKGSQWAIERIAHDGARIVEAKGGETQAAGPRVLIGIKVGGLDATKDVPVDVTATEVK